MLMPTKSFEGTITHFFPSNIFTFEGEVKSYISIRLLGISPLLQPLVFTFVNPWNFYDSY